MRIHEIAAAAKVETLLEDKDEEVPNVILEVGENNQIALNRAELMCLLNLLGDA